MKTYQSILFALLLGLSSCNQNTNREVADTHNSDTLRTKSTNLAASGEFIIDEIPVTATDVGNFPYLSVPEGYKYLHDVEKKLEEKYFFYNDSLVRKISGKYFHTTIFPSGDVFEDTYVVAEYKKAIEKLGGVEIYSGGLPALAGDMIDKEKPVYVSDMYDPRPYKYKQFLIRTPEENIWIELCHGLNSSQIDLTVLREESQKEKGH